MKKLLLTTFLSFIFIHLMYADDGPNIWSTSLSGAGQIWSIAVNPADQNVLYAGSNTTGIWKSTNLGVSWTQSNSGLTNLTVQTIGIGTSNPNVVYCGTSQTGAGAGVYRSTDAGASWTLVNNGIVETSKGIQSIAVDPTDPLIVYAAVFDGLVDSQVGIYKSYDGGDTWEQANIGMGTVKNVLTIVINPLNPDVVYCGTSFGVVSAMGPPHIYKSVDGALNWTDISNGIPNLTTDNKPVRCLSISRADTSVLIAGIFMNTDTIAGMYYTSNGGNLWVRRNNGLPNVVATLTRSCIIRPGSATEFYAGMGNTTNTGVGVFKTTNAGLLWTDFNGGTLSNSTSVRALNFRTLGDSTLYAGGAHPTVATGQGVFEYSSDLTGIVIQNENSPDEFALNQNYPNPFNPNTVISYRIPENSFVSLKVFDMSGKEIMTLVNQMQNTGSYNYSFNGSDLSSGVYYYSLKAGENTITKSMLLVK
ncbi:MAG: T9SS type A sorting domain-containing protein [Ignavibacteria bacterium]|nr:T9SS type A sorting domain-containing protein [Ignavibacteria bacterium]